MKITKLSKKVFFIIGLVLVVVISGTVWAFNKKDTVPKTITTENAAQKGSIDVYIEAEGTVSAEKVNVNFPQTGTLSEIRAQVGDAVSAGDILATIESGKLKYQVDQAKATYDTNVAKANRLKPGSGEEIVVKEAAVNAARIALTAETNIYNNVVSSKGLGSTEELAESAKLRKAETDLLSAEAQLSLTSATYSDARYAVSSSLANLESARLALSEANLRSPMSGVVTSINGVVGQPTGGTQQAASGLITISKLDKLTIISNIDEEDISKISIGQAVESEFTSLGKTITGNVSYVSPVAKTDSNGLVTYEVKIDTQSDGAKIIDGMSANLKFVTRSVENVVKIINKAVKIIDGKSVVSYYDQDKKVLTKPVITGFTDGQYVEISSGMSAGDKYIVTVTK